MAPKPPSSDDPTHAPAEDPELNKKLSAAPDAVNPAAGANSVTPPSSDDRKADEDEVIELDIAHDDTDLVVVTENGYGKRTRVADYPVKGRGGLGVKTIQLTDARGKLAGARVVRDGYQVMLISTGGTVIRIPVEEIKRLGRSTQGVIVMRLRGDDEKVSSLALVMEGADSDSAVDEAAEAAVEAGIEPLAEPDFDEDGFPAASDDDES